MRSSGLIVIFLLMNCDGVIDAYIVIEICCFDSTDQRHIPDAEGRDNSMNMCHFIHAIVPRRVETAVLMTRSE